MGGSVPKEAMRSLVRGHPATGSSGRSRSGFLAVGEGRCVRLSVAGLARLPGGNCGGSGAAGRTGAQTGSPLDPGPWHLSPGPASCGVPGPWRFPPYFPVFGICKPHPLTPSTNFTASGLGAGRAVRADWEAGVARHWEGGRHSLARIYGIVGQGVCGSLECGQNVCV